MKTHALRGAYRSSRTVCPFLVYQSIARIVIWNCDILPTELIACFITRQRSSANFMHFGKNAKSEKFGRSSRSFPKFTNFALEMIRGLIQINSGLISIFCRVRSFPQPDEIPSPFIVVYISTAILTPYHFWVYEALRSGKALQSAKFCMQMSTCFHNWCTASQAQIVCDVESLRSASPPHSQQ